MINLTPYFSLQYKENGREEDGFDCWGFVRFFYKKELDITLPLFSNVNNLKDLSKVKEQFNEVNQPKLYDLVLLKGINNNLTHIGVYLNYSIIHMTKKGVTITQINRINHLIIGYYSIN